MKILTAEQTRAADAYTIEQEPVASIDLMERASKAFCAIFISYVHKARPISIWCGIGNNGGDGLAIARLLKEQGYTVSVFVVMYSQNTSQDFAINFERLQSLGTVPIMDITADSVLPEYSSTEVIIDGLWGSGLNRPVEGFATAVIKYINEASEKGIPVFAIDIPSGLFADRHSTGIAIKAMVTISFQLPKLAFLMPENYDKVGRWEIADIGLDANFIQNIDVFNTYLTQNDIYPNVWRPRPKFAHKGTFGHALLIAGSYGKFGAAVLATKACLRAGAGLASVHLPEMGYAIMQTALPEAMVSIDEDTHVFSQVPEDLATYSTIGIGPGLGKAPTTATALHQLLQAYDRPMVLDADALNLLAEHKDWLALLPVNSILTPHPKEFERLVGKASNDFERQEMQLSFAKEHHVYLILKGANTAIACPDGHTYFNSTGNPGMATAGSGDVLTGMLTGLLSQGYAPKEAALLGVYLHGLSGDLAAQHESQEALIASDLIDYLGAAYQLTTTSAI